MVLYRPFASAPRKSALFRDCDPKGQARQSSDSAISAASASFWALRSGIGDLHVLERLQKTLRTDHQTLENRPQINVPLLHAKIPTKILSIAKTAAGNRSGSLLQNRNFRKCLNSTNRLRIHLHRQELYCICYNPFKPPETTKRNRGSSAAAFFLCGAAGIRALPRSITS